MSSRPSLRSLAAPTILLLWGLSLALPAQAGRLSQGTFTGQRGGSGAYSHQIDRAPGQVSRDTSVTGSQGRLWQRSSNASYDKATGTGQRTVTGPGGNTRTSSGSYDSADKTYSRTITGANDQSVTATSQYNSATHQVDTSYTGPQGQTVTAATGYDKGDHGADTTVTGANGQTYSRNGRNSYDSADHSLNHQDTRPGGRTRGITLTPGGAN